MRRIFLFCAILICAGYTQVRWSLDGVRISVNGAGQRNAECVSDMNYGAIVVWEDDRSGPYDLYAQRVDSSGTLLWTPGGEPVCVGFGYKEAIAICSDEAGGAIVAWQDYRHATGPDIYAQRIDSNGNCLWQAEGVPVCTVVDQQRSIVAVPDGTNGAIIIWADWRDPDPISYSFIYAQRVNSDGVIQWQNNGVSIDTSPSQCTRPAAIKGSNGSAYIVWERDTAGTYPSDLYFQHIDSLGNSLLVIDGKCLFRDSLPQYFPKIVWSNDNAIIIAWVDYRNWQTTGQDIYALRIDTLGNPFWDSTGVPVCTADSTQDCAFSNLVADGFGGAMINWYDRRNGNPDVYAQCIDTNGDPVWQLNGIPVCSLPGVQYEGPGVSDDSMGVIFKWPDDRNGEYEEYLQRIGPDGIIRWESNGVRACTVTTTRTGPGFCTDGKGGAITVWTDTRIDTFNLDIYGQRVNDGHGPGIKETESEIYISDLSLEVYPNPFLKMTNIKFQIPNKCQNPNTQNQIYLNIYDATGRLVRRFDYPTIRLSDQISWNGCDASGKHLPMGIYFCRLELKDKTITEKIILLRGER